MTTNLFRIYHGTMCSATGDILSLRAIMCEGLPMTDTLEGWARKQDTDRLHYDTLELDGQTVLVEMSMDPERD